ncbi:restriction endonuclease subunit S [Aequorivita ciconiae]|uniref:restriction endonuclease subunit S n=1 Tax=Aequorivita ciconiae TaxID=2494375 RepID=UPI0013E378C3|nr:restriction endonuclease subunit S [Aequorivita sp. H23M31]
MFDFLSTNSLSRNQLNYEEEKGVYNIHYGDIHATYKRPILDFEIENRVPKINKEIAISNNADYLKDGDLVIADASEDYEGVGEAIELKNVNDREVISGLHTFAFRDKANKTAEGFRVYIFRNPLVKKALKTIATGSKVYGISKGNLQKFKIVLPTLPEQQKIATILSTWDSAIAKQEQLIAAKQEFKKGLMQLLLSGKKRFEGFEGEWERIKLGDLGELVGGGTPSTKDPDFWNGEIPWISSSDLGQNNLFDLDISRFISQEAIEKSATKLIPAHSILIVSRVGVGKVAINNQDICTSQDFTSLIPNRGDLIFLGYKIQSIIGSLISHNQGTSIKGFTKKSLENLKFKIPLIKEQQRISSVLSAADKEIGLLQSELARLQVQKRGLMQRLLTGEVRVKN